MLVDLGERYAASEETFAEAGAERLLRDFAAEKEMKAGALINGARVVLTGQDGFSGDQARGFSPTPGPYSFGVCAASSSDAHCTVNPGAVPKAMDVVTPTGVLQSDELDYTVHSQVTITDVVIP